MKLHSDFTATMYAIPGPDDSARDRRSVGGRCPLCGFDPSGHLLSSLVILHVCLRPWTGGPTRS